MSERKTPKKEEEVAEDPSDTGLLATKRAKTIKAEEEVSNDEHEDCEMESEEHNEVDKDEEAQKNAGDTPAEGGESAAEEPVVRDAEEVNKDEEKKD